MYKVNPIRIDLNEYLPPNLEMLTSIYIATSLGIPHKQILRQWRIVLNAIKIDPASITFYYTSTNNQQQPYIQLPSLDLLAFCCRSTVSAKAMLKFCIEYCDADAQRAANITYPIIPLERAFALALNRPVHIDTGEIPRHQAVFHLGAALPTHTRFNKFVGSVGVGTYVNEYKHFNKYFPPLLEEIGVDQNAFTTIINGEHVYMLPKYISLLYWMRSVLILPDPSTYKWKFGTALDAYYKLIDEDMIDLYHYACLTLDYYGMQIIVYPD